MQRSNVVTLEIHGSSADLVPCIRGRSFDSMVLLKRFGAFQLVYWRFH